MRSTRLAPLVLAGLGALAGCRTTAPLHPPGSAALVGCEGNGELDWIHLDSGARKRTYATAAHPDEVLVAPSGGLVAVLDREAATITVFDAVDAVQRRVIELPAGARPTDVEFTDRHSRLAVACPGIGALVEVGLKTGEVLANTDCEGTPVALGRDAEGEVLAVALSEPPTLILFDGDERAGARRIGLPSPTSAVAVAPDGDAVWLASASADVLLRVDPNASHVDVLPCPGGPTALRLTPDGARALVLCGGSGDLAAFDTTTRTQLWRATPPAAPSGAPARPPALEREPPGAHLLVVSPNANRLDELDVETADWVRHLTTAPRPTAVGWLRLRTGDPFAGHRRRL